MLLTYQVRFGTANKTLAKRFIQPHDLSAVAKQMSKIFLYQSEKEWVETINYIDDSPSKNALNQIIKAEDQIIYH